MCLDECPSADASEKEIVQAVDRTTLWAQRCQRNGKAERPINREETFGIVQGGRFRDLRMRSAEQLIQMEFPGYAVGGVSVGETEDEMLEQVEMDHASPTPRQASLRHGCRNAASVAENDRLGS